MGLFLMNHPVAKIMMLGRDGPRTPSWTTSAPKSSNGRIS